MLDVTDGWWVAIAVAGVAGLIGGLIYELLQARFGDSGMVENPSRVKPNEGSRSYLDLGWFASMLIGAVAAVGFLYFMPPTDTIAEGTLTREYDPFRLIPAALIVGSAGGAFLGSMQDRLMKVVAQTNNQGAVAVLQGNAPASDDDLVRQGGAGAEPPGQDVIDAAIRVLKSGR